MKPRIVLVTHFEPSGEIDGEFSRFQRGLDLRLLEPSSLPGPGALFANPEGTILAIIAGVGAVQTATTITALGLNPQFDLKESLWLIAGIAGGDPDVCSLGTPVWSDWCVDGDLAWEIDAREMPDSWSTGLLPLGARAPYQKPAGKDGVFGERYERFRLPPDILAWAVAKTEGVPLFSTEDSQSEGQRYRKSLRAASPPKIRVGTTLSAVRFWHGAKMNEWAQAWVRLFTDETSAFHTSSMEDSGTLFAIHFLAKRNLVCADRILLLRTVSNFTRPPDGEPAISTLLASEEEEAYFPGYDPALENGYRVAHAVIQAWLKGDCSL